MGRAESSKVGSGPTALAVVPQPQQQPQSFSSSPTVLAVDPQPQQWLHSLSSDPIASAATMGLRPQRASKVQDRILGCRAWAALWGHQGVALNFG